MTNPNELSRSLMLDKTSTAIQSTDFSSVVNNPYLTLSLQQQRQRLPIFKNRKHILYLIENHQVVIIVGETGCGKSTQLPQYLLESGYANEGKVIGITQPRRVAAVSLANRVAEERGSVVGNEIGYAIRFDMMCDESRTKIKFMTDGLLIRELMTDPLLSKYTVVIVDEAHERTVQTDILLGLLKKILIKRPELRLIIASATIDAELFRDYFTIEHTRPQNMHSSLSTVPAILSVEGRMHPIQIFYSKVPVADFIKSTVKTVLHIHEKEPVGDILAFLTGQDEVESVVYLIQEEAKRLPTRLDKLWVLPMYGALPGKEQLRVFGHTGARSRKVVIATNIAETSVTIPGIVYVIDSGFVKIRVYGEKSGMESLMVVPTSQASAEQRAGRAGRLRPGKCYRLYQEDQFHKLLPSTVPEMQRTNLAPTILQLKALGVENVLRFAYISRPPAFAMVRGLELLYALGAISENGHFANPVGEQMAELPLVPMHSRAILSSVQFGCVSEMLSIISILQVNDVFLQPSGRKREANLMKRKFASQEGDHLTLLNVYNAFESSERSNTFCQQTFLNYRALIRAGEIRQQLLNFCKKFKIKLNKEKAPLDNIRKCLVCAFFSQAARLHFTGIYHTIREQYPLKVHQGSSITFRDKLPEWVIFSEVYQDSIREVTEINKEWLHELAPHFYEYGTANELATKRQRLD